MNKQKRMRTQTTMFYSPRMSKIAHTRFLKKEDWGSYIFDCGLLVFEDDKKTRQLPADRRLCKNCNRARVAVDRKERKKLTKIGVI